MATKIQDMTRDQLNNWLAKHWQRLDQARLLELIAVADAMEFINK